MDVVPENEKKPSKLTRKRKGIKNKRGTNESSRIMCPYCKHMVVKRLQKIPRWEEKGMKPEGDSGNSKGFLSRKEDARKCPKVKKRIWRNHITTPKPDTNSDFTKCHVCGKEIKRSNFDKHYFFKHTIKGKNSQTPDPREMQKKDPDGKQPSEDLFASRRVVSGGAPGQGKKQ